MQSFSMAVCCPNCGQKGYRTYSLQPTTGVNLCPQRQVMQTECPHCDYLMVMCVLNGRVLETDASGISIASRLPRFQMGHPADQQPMAEAVVWAVGNG